MCVKYYFIVFNLKMHLLCVLLCMYVGVHVLQLNVWRTEDNLMGSLSLLPSLYETKDCIQLIRLDQQTLPGGPSCKPYLVS